MKNCSLKVKGKLYGSIAFLFVFIGVVILICFTCTLRPEHLNLNDISLEKVSQIGNFIGGIAGFFFPLAAFFLLYATLNAQREEINENKKTLQKQAFENHFFQMINIHNDFVKEFDIHNDGKIISVGKDSFSFVYKNEFKRNYLKSKILEKEYVKENFNKFLLKWDDDLGHYFKLSLGIIKYIASNSKTTWATEEDKCFYLELFNSKLSYSEKILLFYYIMCKGDKDIQVIIKDYDFFKDILATDLLDLQHLKWAYEKAK